MSTNGLGKSIRATAAASEAVLNEMFDFLVCKLCAAKTPREALVNLICLGEDTFNENCDINGDRKLRFMQEFMRTRGLDEDAILTWMEDNYLSGDEERCDCLTLRLLASYVARY
jgi:hypothetical protein